MLCPNQEQTMESNIRYQGAKIWNAISDNIKLLSLKQFKKSSNQALLQAIN